MERMQELLTPPEASTLESTTMARLLLRFLQMPILTFTSELERVATPQKLQSRFKTPGSITVRRFSINRMQPGGSSGLEARQEPELSGSGRSSGSGTGGMETSPRAIRVVRPLTGSTTKQPPEGTTPSLLKRPILSPPKGSSSKRSKN